MAGADGWSGVPARHSTPDAEPNDSEADRAPILRGTSACAGGATLHRTEGAKRLEEDADGVTASLARRVPLGDCDLKSKVLNEIYFLSSVTLFLKNLSTWSPVPKTAV